MMIANKSANFLVSLGAGFIVGFFLSALTPPKAHGAFCWNPQQQQSNPHASQIGYPVSTPLADSARTRQSEKIQAALEETRELVDKIIVTMNDTKIGRAHV